jgi:AraC-like DNA-binding protein
MATAPSNRQPLIKALWAASGTAAEAVLPGVVVPDAHVEFVFHLERPWRMRRVDEAGWQTQPQAFVFAQSHGALRFEGDGATSVIAFRAAPVVACSILGRPVTEIWNQPVALRDLVGADADALCEQLSSAGAAERFSVLAGWIERRLSSWTAEHFAVQRLFDRVMWSPAGGGLARLSKQLGWSDRGLRRVITRAAGLAPKDVQLAGRHLDACALLREQPQLDITEIAGCVGFFDHAAFTHSFRERVGMSPSQFRAERHAFYERRPAPGRFLQVRS